MNRFSEAELPGTPVRRTSPRQVAVVAILSIVPTIAHYATDPHNGPAHDIYQRFYYLPVILAGLWFGVRGGLATAALIAVAYFPHALHGWHGPYSVFYRLMEIVMYVVVGWLTGWLSDRLRAASASEHQARMEVERAYANLKAKADELFALEEQLCRADRLAALGQLTAGLAHEIRNPRASIKASAEILRARDGERNRAGDEPDFTGIVLEETARLDNILTEFLQFARAEQNRPSDEPQCARVATAVRRVLDLTESQRQKSGVRVAMDEAALDVSVAICGSHLQQVFLNLLINSVDAMPGGGEVRIARAKDEAGLVVLHVEDTGPGIPSDQASKVFDPFYSTKADGTGLGLSIVERILDSHGGSIALAAPAEGGAATSRFVLKLPRAR